MLGFVIGAISLVGLMRLLRRRHGGGRWHHHRHGCGGGGCGHHRGHRDDRGFDDDGFGFDSRGGFDRGDRNAPVFLRGLFERLQTSASQERVIIDALRELKGSFGKAKTAAKKSARDLGDALRGEQLSVDSMGTVFASLDEGQTAVRDGAFSALSKIHEVLDERQRKILADLISRGGGLEDLADAV